MTDIAKLVAELTLDEKAALTAGADLWSTTAVPRLGIPQVRLTDGPQWGSRHPVRPGRPHRRLRAVRIRARRHLGPGPRRRGRCELAVREGGSLGLMTSYNRVNGRWCTEQGALITGILRDEWGFEGFVVTDWFGITGTVASALAGVDLEMPGPARAFGPALAPAVRAGEIGESVVDGQVTRLLTVFDRIGALEATEPGPGADAHGVDRPEDRELARRAATESMVLLANDGLLPLDRSALSTVALIGPNADRAQIMGGGSASLRPHYLVTPLEALRAALGDGVRVVHEPGCDNRRSTPTLGGRSTEAPTGGVGFDLDYFADADLGGEVVHRSHTPALELFALEPPAPGLPRSGWSLRAVTRFMPTESGAHVFTLIQGGTARLTVGDRIVIDGFADVPPAGDAFYGMGSVEVEAPVELRAGAAVDVVVEFTATGRGGQGALKVGCRHPEPPDLLERAVVAAAEADAAVLVVGTTGEWESEGHDRASMDLPGAQDELVRRVLEANPATVVVVNAASPVTMDWAAAAPAVLQVWFGGQEMAAGLAEVLLGDAEPAGRLPMTLPLRLEHNPSFGNFPGENGQVRYGEGVLVGYRWYEARHLPTRFPFGHGGSYTTFAVGEPALSMPSCAVEALATGDRLVVTVPVTNTGDRPGAEVVQCYVAPIAPRLVPPKELAGFAKLWLDPGETATARIELDDRALAYWDGGQPNRDAIAARAKALPMRRPSGSARMPGWQVDPGRYELHIGRSSAAIDHVLAVEIIA
jgi:beta-glucosidase